MRGAPVSNLLISTADSVNLNASRYELECLLRELECQGLECQCAILPILLTSNADYAKWS